MAKRIDPIKLSRFRTIVREGGFSRAAEKLYITQPALSQSMAQFEEELGLKLFEPGRRGGVPTIYGACLLDYADAIRLQLDRAAEHIERPGARHQRRRGDLRGRKALPV